MKVLIVKTSSIGDIIQSFCVIAYLQKIHADIQIDWIVEERCKELVLAHPQLRKVLVFDSKKWTFAAIRKLRKERYDVLFDLQGNAKSSLITFLARAKKKVGFDKQSVAEWINLLFTNVQVFVSQTMNIRLQYLYLVQHFFADTVSSIVEQPIAFAISNASRLKVQAIFSNISQEICVINIGAKWESKHISLKLLEKILEKLQKRYNYYFLFINHHHTKKIQEICSRTKNCRCLPKLSLLEIYEILKRADVLISSDSSILHLGAIAAISTVSVFGPSSAFIYKPMGKNHMSLQGHCPYGYAFSKRCKYLRSCQSKACMKNISPDDLLMHIERLKKNRHCML